jgi:hypothetical protein
MTIDGLTSPKLTRPKQVYNVAAAVCYYLLLAKACHLLGPKIVIAADSWSEMCKNMTSSWLRSPLAGGKIGQHHGGGAMASDEQRLSRSKRVSGNASHPWAPVNGIHVHRPLRRAKRCPLGWRWEMGVRPSAAAKAAAGQPATAAKGDTGGRGDTTRMAKGPGGTTGKWRLRTDPAQQGTRTCVN